MPIDKAELLALLRDDPEVRAALLDAVAIIGDEAVKASVGAVVRSLQVGPMREMVKAATDRGERRRDPDHPVSRPRDAAAADALDESDARIPAGVEVARVRREADITNQPAVTLTVPQQVARRAGPGWLPRDPHERP